MKEDFLSWNAPDDNEREQARVGLQVKRQMISHFLLMIKMFNENVKMKKKLWLCNIAYIILTLLLRAATFLIIEILNKLELL